MTYSAQMPKWWARLSPPVPSSQRGKGVSEGIHRSAGSRDPVAKAVTVVTSSQLPDPRTGHRLLLQKNPAPPAMRSPESGETGLLLPAPTYLI